MKKIVIPMSIILCLTLPTHAKPLQMQEANITCQGKPFTGLRGTLTVPQNRSQANAQQIALPIVVVKSLSPAPDYPVFQCTGGPGDSNIGPEQRIGEADLKDHDVVQVGYRGVDGSPKLKHALLDEILRPSSEAPTLSKP
jgi:hypothetical protein